MPQESPYSCLVRVYYEDTDSSGLVYHANYLKFMERARTEWLRARGFEQDVLRREQGILFVVSRIFIAYHRPARFNDSLRVEVNIESRGRASIRLLQPITRNAGELVCHGRVRVACVSAHNHRPCAIPPLILQELERDC